MALEHHEMMLLARLLGNHVTGTGTPLVTLADKLLDYAERMGGYEPYNPRSLPPLDLEYVKGASGRVMFCEVMPPDDAELEAVANHNDYLRG